MSPEELLKYKVGIELYPHHTVDIALIDILDDGQKVVSEDNGSMTEIDAHGVPFKDSRIEVCLLNQLIFASDFYKNL